MLLVSLATKFYKATCGFAVLLVLLSGCQHRGQGTLPPSKVRIIAMAGAQTRRGGPREGIHFRDVAEAAGLRYVWQPAGEPTPNILQTIGNGCAFLDFDNDGNLDVLLVGEHPALFKGDGKGHFTDVTAAFGLNSVTGHFLGCAVGDVDGDGFDDIYLTGYQTGVLLHNEGGRAFRDITVQAGLKPQPWGTSCAFGETIPGSGKLDLYVANYVAFGPDSDPQLCTSTTGYSMACGPESYPPLRGTFYTNDGKGHFTDSTQASGLNVATGKGLGVSFGRLGDTGTPSLVVADDRVAGDLFQPEKTAGSGTTTPRFHNMATEAGTAFDRDGNEHAGMGVDIGDYDNDGHLDIFVTTYRNEPRSLYRNRGNNLFSDVGMGSGFGAETFANVAWGCKFFDFDNDGWLDLIIANGHPQEAIHDIDVGAFFRQPTQLFRNAGGRSPGFDDVSASSPDFARRILGRGVATGDFDNDGRVDALVVDSAGKPLLLHNECTPVGHWLGVRLVGTKSNRDGYGAMLTAKVGKASFLQTCQTCGSYLSASDGRVHFGLNKARRIDSLTVLWSSGTTSVYKNLSVDRYITLTEGEQAASTAAPMEKAEGNSR